MVCVLCEGSPLNVSQFFWISFPHSTSFLFTRMTQLDRILNININNVAADYLKCFVVSFLHIEYVTVMLLTMKTYQGQK